jgi:hypothetical protein
MRAFEQQKARLADMEAKLKLAEKKARTRRLIESGILVEKVGLLDLSPDTLYGALLSLRPGADSAKQKEQWANSGARARADDMSSSDDRKPIVLKFADSLSRDVGSDLRANGFRFNKVLRHWEGIATIDDAQKLADTHAGSLQLVTVPEPDGEDP